MSASFLRARFSGSAPSAVVAILVFRGGVGFLGGAEFLLGALLDASFLPAPALLAAPGFFADWLRFADGFDRELRRSMGLHSGVSVAFNRFLQMHKSRHLLGNQDQNTRPTAKTPRLTGFSKKNAHCDIQNGSGAHLILHEARKTNRAPRKGNRL